MTADTEPHILTRINDGFIKTPEGVYPVEYVENEILLNAPWLTIAIYRALEDLTCDFADIFIPAGTSTPIQVVNDGRMIDYPHKGDFAVIVQRKSGTIETNVFRELDPETYHARGEYQIGDVLCCVALGNEGARFIEQSSPPYRNGMFGVINEQDPRISDEFLLVRKRILVLGEEQKPYNKESDIPTVT